MRDDLARLRRQLERARPWAKGGRVAVRLPVLEALLDIVDAGDRLTGFAVGTGLPKSRARLTEAMGEPSDFERAIGRELGGEIVESSEIGGCVEP